MSQLSWDQNDVARYNEWCDTPLGRKFIAFVNTQRPEANATTSEMMIRQLGEAKGFEDLYRLMTVRMRTLGPMQVRSAHKSVDLTKD